MEGVIIWQLMCKAHLRLGFCHLDTLQPVTHPLHVRTQQARSPCPTSCLFRADCGISAVSRIKLLTLLSRKVIATFPVSRAFYYMILASFQSHKDSWPSDVALDLLKEESSIMTSYTADSPSEHISCIKVLGIVIFTTHTNLHDDLLTANCVTV